MEMSSGTVRRTSELPHVDGMDRDWSEVISNKVQEMCENWKKRNFETAVIILDNGNGKILTYGSSVGAAFFLSRPDIVKMFQDFCKIYSKDQVSIGSDVICETPGNKGRDYGISDNSDNLEEVDCEDCSSMKSESDNQRECDEESGDQECDEEKHSEDSFVESKRITRQSQKISIHVRVASKCRKKKKSSSNFEKTVCVQKSQNGSQMENELADEKTVKSAKHHVEVKAQSVFECSECNKLFKSQAGLTAHCSYVHLKAKSGSEFAMPDYSLRNLELQYLDKDGNKTSGLRSSMYDKETTNEDTKFLCKMCSYSTAKYNVMIEHTQTHVIRDPLACSLCQKTFQAKKSLWRHTNQHKKFPHMCKICLRMYVSREDLKDHEITHKPSHVCSICDKTYDSVGRLNYHIKTSHGPKQNTCEICGSSFTNKSLLRQHKKRHGPKQFFCDKCSCSYYFMHQLTNHLKIHDENSLKFKCNVCTKEYINKSHWKEHMKLHDGANFVQCDQCGKSYNSRKSLNLHKSSTHVNERRFICQVCGKAFMTKHHLKNHLISHDDKRDFKCRFCDATFKKNDVLKMHENVHTREQKFMCDICGEHFLRRSSLRNHRLTHFPGHQRWKCRYCEDKFRTQSAMLTHIKNKHADLDLSHDRPLCKRCEQCGKVFAKGLTFRIHMDMHAGIKRHKCTVCSSAFTDPANLRVHQKIHDGTSKKFVCENCDSRFSSVKQYTIHMQKHGNSEKYAVGSKFTVTETIDERNEAIDASLRTVTCGMSHDDVPATMPAIVSMNSSQEQVSTNQIAANTCHGLMTDSHLKDNPNIQATVMNTNTGAMNSSHDQNIASFSEAQLRPNAPLCSNTLTQSVGGSVRQGMDIKNYDHIQLYYSAMF